MLKGKQLIKALKQMWGQREESWQTIAPATQEQTIGEYISHTMGVPPGRIEFLRPLVAEVCDENGELQHYDVTFRFRVMGDKPAES